MNIVKTITFLPAQLIPHDQNSAARARARDYS